MQSDLGRLERTFIRMNQDGFNTEKPLRWGFFFISRDKTKLEKVYQELKDHDYLLQSLEPLSSEEWKLQVIKIDILTPLKLHNRNIAFNDLAEYCGVDYYDGWDVEKI